MSQRTLSVSQLNDYIQRLIGMDSVLAHVAVSGEISNYKVYPSGHHYFTLKDDSASVKCVMFKSSAIRLRFRPENGMKIIAMGKISVYPRDGAYQLYCSAMMVDGVGDLHAAFEQLKTKLAAQGLFEPSHKKPIPQYPKVIGIVTSSAGAAIHDMLRILRKRYPLTKVVLLPVRVQGTEAPGEIASAIDYANHYRLADLLIVGRGGGSIEDLWAFNDEQVANAIYRSEIPVISAVGHEPDVTISDYVADLRAATPSNAAELAVPDAVSLHQYLDTLLNQMSVYVSRQLKTAKNHLQTISGSPALQSPVHHIHQRCEKLMHMKTLLLANQQQQLNRKHNRFVTLTAALDAMSPLKVLTRGYAMVTAVDGSVIRSVQQTKTGELINVLVSDGKLTATVEKAEEGKP